MPREWTRGLQFGLEENLERSPKLLASISNASRNDKQLAGVRLQSFCEQTKQQPFRQLAHVMHANNNEIHNITMVLGGILMTHFGRAKDHMTTWISKDRSELRITFPWPQRSTETVSRESVALAENLIAKGQKYERALDVRAAVQCFEEAARVSPSSLLGLCLLAKQWSDLTFYHDVRSTRERQFVNLKALEYAERAITAHPSNHGGYIAACVCKGRLALFMDNRNKVRLAKEAQEAAMAALEHGPTNDLAHHLMGRWHYEMSRVNPLVRAAVRLMYGTALRPGSKQEALDSFKRASELSPNRLVHHVEMGRVHYELGNHDEARRAMERALKCEISDINDWQTRFDAEQILAAIERRPFVKPNVQELVPPGVKA